MATSAITRAILAPPLPEDETAHLIVDVRGNGTVSRQQRGFPSGRQCVTQVVDYRWLPLHVGSVVEDRIA